MDYILYQVNKPTVLLEDEIQHIKNYVSLEKIRFGDNLNIEFNHLKNYNNILIPPMLLLPFVENAFKQNKEKKSNSYHKIKFFYSYFFYFLKKNKKKKKKNLHSNDTTAFFILLVTV